MLEWEGNLLFKLPPFTIFSIFFLDLKLHSRAQMHGLLSPALSERVCVLLAISNGYNSI